ncbi:hypothetical protein [Microbacterium sp. SA39]|uniref:hypothetical protein n=1 Tax=Microbacterium sp. SA39 TaxID=1263625 RepID=UPI0005F9C3F7|nr:hypothetical protein [Microbacterium sp. SA39]KJQ55081.1 hypothetical protein RS85_01140 [Microbacterium sp. SA39]
MNTSRDHDIAFYTALSAAFLGVGLLLFAPTTRTVEAPFENVLSADVGTYLLLGTAVVATVLALLARRGRHVHRDN